MAVAELDFKAAFVGPGQAGQEPGMGERLAKQYSELVMPIWDLTDQVHLPTLKYKLTDLIWHNKINGEEVSPEEAKAELKKTHLTQSAVFADSVSRWVVGTETGRLPNAGVHAGFSLGRLVACVTSGVLDYRDAIPLVKARGDAFFSVPGWLLAFDNVNPDITRILLDQGSQRMGESTIYRSMIMTQLSPAVGGSPESKADMQTWLADNNLEEGIDYSWVQVSGPFHTPAMQPARENYASALKKTPMREPTRGKLFGNNGRLLENPDDTIADLEDQTTETENFLRIGQTMYEIGVNNMFCLSAKKAEVGMLGIIAQSVKLQIVKEEFKTQDTTTTLAHRLRVTGKAA